MHFLKLDLTIIRPWFNNCKEVIFLARPNVNFAVQKQELIEIAFSLFSEKGYEQTTIREVMKKTGLTNPVMYHYFKSKEELLNAAIDYGIIQYTEQLEKTLEGMPVTEKMLLFTSGIDYENDYFAQIVTMRNQNPNSFASYRIREKLIHAYIPIMENIILDGVKEGIYQMTYPRQSAEFMVLLVKSIYDTNILPLTDSTGHKMRIAALIELIDYWLHPTKKHLDELSTLFYNTCERTLWSKVKGR